MKKGFRIIKFKKDKPVFQIKNINKSYEGRPILKKITMDLYPGECVGLLGPNGSGKSTLYSTIIGETYADAGKILINGKEIQDRPIHLRAKAGIGYLSQQRSVFAISVYDNLLGICQLCIKGTVNQIKKTEQLLDEFNLQHLRNIHASNLSGGEVRRLMLARLLINKPSVVLLDEPMAALDPIVVQDIQKYILKLQTYGCAILVTDHQVNNLFDIVDRAYVLGEQSIIAQGTPDEILKSVKKGLYMVNFGGGQVDITSGKFVFSCTEGYEIVDGKICSPIKGATLIGDGPKALKKIRMVGNDSALDDGIGTCGKAGQSVPVGVGQPTLRIDGITVGGTS